MTQKQLDPDPSWNIYIKAALEKKVIAPVILDLRGLTSIADIFIVLSGRSNRQVMAIAEHIKQDLKKQGHVPLNIEGKQEGLWILLDYGHVVIHVFYDTLRSFYDLEGLWCDAKRVKTKNLLEYEKKLKEELIP